MEGNGRGNYFLHRDLFRDFRDRFNFFFFPFGGIYHVYRMVNDPFQASSFVKQRTGFTAISIKKG